MSNLDLTIETKKEDNKLTFSFIGSINEDFTFEDLISEQSEIYIFDLEKVTLLNSCGIREWIRFLDKLGPQVKLIYRNCPPVVILQMNMVKGFLTENASVESFYAPYYDEDNDEELKVLLKTDEISENKAPEKLSKSGKPLEFDGVEATYFRFLLR